MIKERDKTLDTAKGIFIILVVSGHSTFPYTDVIYWFHMPEFFIVSGILYKEDSLRLLNVFVRFFTNPDFNELEESAS